MPTTEDHKEASQVYEVGYLVLPSIAEDSLPQVVDSIKEIITKNGGKTLDGEMPMLLDLAYPLSKIVGASKYVVNDAYFGWQKFEAESGSVIEAIKSELDKKDELVRFLLVKTERETRFTLAKARAKMTEKLDSEGEGEVVEGDKPALPVETE
jgi:ribosomal protein S6